MIHFPLCGVIILAVLQGQGPSRQQLNLVYSTTLAQGQNPFRLKLGFVCRTSYLVVLQGQGPSRQQLNLVCFTTLAVQPCCPTKDKSDCIHQCGNFVKHHPNP